MTVCTCHVQQERETDEDMQLAVVTVAFFVVVVVVFLQQIQYHLGSSSSTNPRCAKHLHTEGKKSQLSSNQEKKT